MKRNYYSIDASKYEAKYWEHFIKFSIFPCSSSQKEIVSFCFCVDFFFISVEVEVLEILQSPEGFKNFFGKKAEIFVTLNIYVPKNQNGISVVEVFSRICDTLMKDNLKEQILSIESGDLEFNKNANAFVLNCILRLEAFIGNETNEPDITNIIVKGEI